MTKLYIARHGNTFSPEETPRRVGLKTNIPLSNSGKAQAKALGQYFKTQKLTFDAVFTSELQRTQQTATIALKETQPLLKPISQKIFNEVDYGPDENKTEAEVINRIGSAALKEWDKNASVPAGWKIDPENIIQQWQTFAHYLTVHYANANVLVVTSNGIARFAPYLLNDFDEFKNQHSLKMKTGAISCFDYNKNHWQLVYWNHTQEA